MIDSVWQNSRASQPGGNRKGFAQTNSVAKRFTWQTYFIVSIITVATSIFCIAKTLAEGGTHPAAPPPEYRPLIFPEQRRIEVRAPEQFRPANLPPVPTPPTVSQPLPENATWTLSLDEAIRIALENSDIVRVLAGNTAVPSGATIYDPAISNTQIDLERGRFDPRLRNDTFWNQSDQPLGQFNPAPPPTSIITGSRAEGFSNSTGISKRLLTGATAEANFNVNRNDNRFGFFPLNPQTANSTELALTQPLLQGGGYRANIAPIIIARINTEFSFFQYKDAVQNLVFSVIEAYWNLQFAQIDVWVREQQVNSGLEALERAEGRALVGLANEGEAAQARVSYENFRANLIAAQANLWASEGVLRNLLGISPSDGRRIVPGTPLSVEQIPLDWYGLRALAETYRPNLIELKLILEADEQQLILAQNQALPRLDAVGLYRWNGLEGKTPEGVRIVGDSADYQEWQTGVNFSVPLGLRSERATLRQRQLLLTRDRANLDQGLHQAAHELAASYRDLANTYEQYLAFKRTREAAFINIEQQLAAFQANTRILYLNVLLAITDWGNSVRNENQALVLYNTVLARLEAQTGTILETHGIRFAEERYGSVGPLGRHFRPVLYPQSMPPTPNVDLPRASGEQAYKLPEKIVLPEIEDIPPPNSAPQPVPPALEAQPQSTPAEELPPVPPLPDPPLSGGLNKGAMRNINKPK
ncbi:MAG: TolC family protein [Pirellulales bacterium]|nr:TolC family protein [Pirellulales bacterium]